MYKLVIGIGQEGMEGDRFDSEESEKNRTCHFFNKY